LEVADRESFSRRPVPALAAGAAYFALIFTLGFVLGTVRVLVLAPRLGELTVVLLELPVMLAASWIACDRLIARFGVPTGTGHRFAMGAAAFGLLIAAEWLLGHLAFGRSLTEQLARYRSWPAAAGLAGQLAFATFPMLRSRWP
jgi:hypothetical protein